ncbi:MAG: CHAP domain-containing protein [Alphaproteobacteria bacterium]|nr:CHAP domain-containing protein [Alphaproteobacteria bacterium]
MRPRYATGERAGTTIRSRLLPALLSTLLGASGCHAALRPAGPLSAVREVAPAPRRPTATRPRPAPPPTAPPAPADDTGARLAAAARALLDGPAPGGFRDDCSGFVCAVGHRAGVDLDGDTAALWALAVEAGAVHHRHRPEPGDLVFFDQTYDRNGNHRLDDALTHTGVVVEVDGDGTVLVAHRSTSRGRTLLHLNLDRPHDAVDAQGRPLNDYLRRRTSRDPRGTAYLAGELWRGFATVRAADLPTWAPPR